MAVMRPAMRMNLPFFISTWSILMASAEVPPPSCSDLTAETVPTIRDPLGISTPSASFKVAMVFAVMGSPTFAVLVLRFPAIFAARTGGPIGAVAGVAGAADCAGAGVEGTGWVGAAV